MATTLGTQYNSNPLCISPAFQNHLFRTMNTYNWSITWWISGGNYSFLLLFSKNGVGLEVY